MRRDPLAIIFTSSVYIGIMNNELLSMFRTWSDATSEFGGMSVKDEIMLNNARIL